MKTELLKFLFVILLLELQFCNVRQNKKQSKTMVSKEITLIKTIPGGGRSHIIVLTSNGFLRYNVGSISNLDIFDYKNIDISNAYIQKKYNIDSIEIKKINTIISILEKQKPFVDTTIIKDDWQYYIYFDGKKMMFGYEQNISEFPKEWRELIDFILKKVGKLHKLPGMS